MYSALWSPGLRQGDVLGELPFAISSNKVEWSFQGSVTGTVSQQAGYAFVRAQPRFVMVVSHDCEFNENKRSHFLVARIESIGKITDEEREVLIAGNDVMKAIEEERHVPLDTFYLEPIPGVFEDARRVNFCAITSFAMELTKEILGSKKAELQHDQRIRLRNKLGVFFGRDAEDIPEDQKAAPPPKDEGGPAARVVEAEPQA